MKKHLVIIMNVVLILAIIGAVIFTVISAMNKRPDDAVATPAEHSATVTEAQEETTGVKDHKIGIIQHGLGTASKDCYEGFISELNERGLLNSVELVYIVEDDEDLCRQKIQQLVDSGCDLLYTIGRFATETSATITKDIPVIFAAVSSPDELGLVESNEHPGGNVTGVSSYTPCFDQIDLIPTLLPEAKSVAAIYSATDTDAVMQGIIASKEAATIGITCDQYPVEDEKALADALSKIKEQKTSVIYIPVDKFLSAHIDTLNAFSYENKIPVICGDEATLERGAFATSVINYSSIGRKAAGLADDVLYGGKSPAELSVIYKHDCTNIVNKTTRDKLGVRIPATALEKVDIRDIPAPTEAAVSETTE